MDRRIGSLLDVIDTNFSDSNLNCKRLAGMVRLSSRRVEELFKQEMGTTLMRHLKARRLQEASVLLTTQFMTVKEVANLVGYKSYSHFIHDFTSHYGMSPSKYVSGFSDLKINIETPGVSHYTVTSQRIASSKR